MVVCLCVLTLWYTDNLSIVYSHVSHPIGSVFPRDPQKISRIDNGWMAIVDRVSNHGDWGNLVWALTTRLTQWQHPIVVSIFQSEPRHWTDPHYHTKQQVYYSLKTIMSCIISLRWTTLLMKTKLFSILWLKVKNISHLIPFSHTLTQVYSPPLVAHFLAITNKLLMSSESWVESCTEGRGDMGLEKKQDGVQTEEVEVPCQDDQPAEPANLRPEVCSSVEHSGTQEVTSEGGLEQVQREERQRKKFSHVSVNREGRARGSGVCGT